MTFEINVKFKCPNICSKEDLENKTALEIFKDITDNFYMTPSLFCDQYEILSIDIKDETETL